MYEELEKIKNELFELIDKNYESMDNIKGKINIIWNTTFMNRLTNFARLFVVGMLITWLIYMPIVAINIFSLELVFKMIPASLLFASPIFGALLETIPASINKRKLKQISNAKTSEEKKEEILSYEIELEKLNNKNIALEKTHDYICEKQDALKFFEGSLSDTNRDSIYELTEKNNTLNSLREKKEEELDIISTQSVLNSEFSHTRNRVYKYRGVLINSVMAMVFTPILVFTGALVLSPLSFTSTLPSFVLPLSGASSVLAGIITAGITTNIFNKDMRRFEKFNEKLGKRKLARFDENKGETTKINRLTKETIEELSRMYIELKENEGVLSQARKKVSEKTLHETLSKEYTYKDVKEEKLTVLDFIEDDALVDNKEDGPKLVKR